MSRTPNNGRFSRRSAGVIRGVFVGVVVVAFLVVVLFAAMWMHA